MTRSTRSLPSSDGVSRAPVSRRDRRRTRAHGSGEPRGRTSRNTRIATLGDRALATLKQAPAYASDTAGYVEATRRVLADMPNGETSLGVPTWVYPDEPVNLFSSHIAKYFSNGMREEGLIAIGSHGVVIASDTPGTVREVFQAAEQNSYWVGDRRSPMVLLGVHGASAFELFIAYARRDGYADMVRSFADPREAVDFLVRTPPLTRPSPAPTKLGAGVRRMRYRRPG